VYFAVILSAACFSMYPFSSFLFVILTIFVICVVE
jgi:hypothetical protein